MIYPDITLIEVVIKHPCNILEFFFLYGKGLKHNQGNECPVTVVAFAFCFSFFFVPVYVHKTAPSYHIMRCNMYV